MADDSTARAQALIAARSPTTTNVTCMGCGARWILGSEGSRLNCPDCGTGSLRVVREVPA